MARMRFTGKIELAILALTLAVQVVKLVREHRRKESPADGATVTHGEPKPIRFK